MTVRIALLGHHASDGAAPSPGADVEVRHYDVAALRTEEVQGADGLWVLPGAAPSVGDTVSWARSASMPVGGDVSGAPPWSGPGLDPAFVDAARTRSHWREGMDARAEAARATQAAEAQPRPFVHQMRGPRMRWWRPLLWLLLFGAVYGALVVAVVLPLSLTGLVPADEQALVESPTGLAVLNLTLVLLLPATLLAAWAGFRRGPGRVLSVAGRVRWGWLGRCLLVVLPVWLVHLGVAWVVFDQQVLPRPEQWVGLLLSALLLTPLQATAEEVFFRGGLLQALGAWVRDPRVAFVVTTLVTSAAFAAAHGSSDPWIVAELCSLAVVGCYLAWRTGGLEAAIAVHVVNNVLITVIGALAGGLDASFVDTESTGSPVSAALSWVSTLVVAALLLRLGRRRGVVPPGWLTPAVG